VRRIILLVVLLGCGLASAKWLRAGWDHARLLYWQRKCLAYSAPADRVIDQSGKQSVKEWQEFYALLSPPGRKAAPVVFLGEMRTRGGRKRLVAVEVSLVGASTFDGVIWFDYHVIEPGGLWHRPRLVKNDFDTVVVWKSEASNVKLFAGQRDPGDPSHFKITFETHARQSSPARAGVIDGWLQENDTISSETRKSAPR
jgi:hypothetical protein